MKTLILGSLLLAISSLAIMLMAVPGWPHSLSGRKGQWMLGMAVASAVLSITGLFFEILQS